MVAPSIIGRRRPDATHGDCSRSMGAAMHDSVVVEVPKNAVQKERGRRRQSGNRKQGRTELHPTRAGTRGVPRNQGRRRAHRGTGEKRKYIDVRKKEAEVGGRHHSNSARVTTLQNFCALSNFFAFCAKREEHGSGEKFKLTTHPP